MKNNEKLARQNFKAWQQSSATELSDIYGKYSTRKISAWRNCRYLCQDYDGWNLKLVNHNSFVFTAGFEYVDKETGVLKFMYITPSYNTSIEQ